MINGGVSTITSSEDTGINANQVSDDFSMNIQNSVQQNIGSTSSDSLAYVLTDSTNQQAPSQIESVTFASRI